MSFADSLSDDPPLVPAKQLYFSRDCRCRWGCIVDENDLENAIMYQRYPRNVWTIVEYHKECLFPAHAARAVVTKDSLTTVRHEVK